MKAQKQIPTPVTMPPKQSIYNIKTDPNRIEVITKFIDQLRDKLINSDSCEFSCHVGSMADPLADNRMCIHLMPDGHQTIQIDIYNNPFRNYPNVK